MVERLTDILPKSVSRTSRADPPTTPIIRVGPEQIAHGTLVGHFLNTVQSADVVQRVDTRRQATVQAEDLVVNKCCERQVVEKIGEEFPHVGVSVLAQTFVVEAVNLGDLSALVVATEDGDALRVADLECDQQSDGLDGEVATIDVVSHEEVVGVWVGSTDLEQLHQVVELAVDITTDGDGTFHGLHVGFVLEHLTRLFAQPSHVLLGELLAGHQGLDPAVETTYRRRVDAGAQRVLHLVAAYILHCRIRGLRLERRSLHVGGGMGEGVRCGAVVGIALRRLPL